MADSYNVTSKSAGDRLYGPYVSRYLTFAESVFTHPAHDDGFVDKGDPVVIGTETGDGLAGIAEESAASASQEITIDTEGIFVLTVIAKKEAGQDSAIAIGDRLYIHKSNCQISKNSGYRQFGYALSTLTAGETGLVSVRVHNN